MAKRWLPKWPAKLHQTLSSIPDLTTFCFFIPDSVTEHDPGGLIGIVLKPSSLLGYPMGDK